MILWIGQSVSPQVLQDLLGVDDINSLNRNLVRCRFGVGVICSHIVYYFSLVWPFARRDSPLRCRILYWIGPDSEAEHPSFASLDKIWMVRRSTSVICLSKTRIMALCHISTVRHLTYARIVLLNGWVDLCVIHKQISTVVRVYPLFQLSVY